jgi:hypothetical protein
MVAPATRGERRCTYAGCDRPEHGSDFHHIEAGRRSGGQDWSPLAGSTLCNACYQQYKRRGTLERSRNKPIAAGARRCTYANCEKPDHGTKFFLIEQGKNTASKDWSSIVGMVLCKACYQQFIRSGKLERSRNKPLTNGARRCSYPDCDRPEHGSCFYQIETGKTAGWAPLTDHQQRRHHQQNHHHQLRDLILYSTLSLCACDLSTSSSTSVSLSSPRS